MIFKLKTAPAIEPIMVQDAKAHMRVETDEDDLLISRLITMARSRVEIITLRALITQTWELYMDKFPSDEIELSRAPIQSLTSIAYTKTDGTAGTVTSYQLDKSTEPARLSAAYGESWPATKNILNAVLITFVSGYGVKAEDVPEELKHAIKLIVAEFYERREHGIVAAQISRVPLNAEWVLWPYRVFI